MWPWPGKEQLSDVDRAILITTLYKPTVLTAIRTFPERHRLLVFAAMTRPGHIVFIYGNQLFPIVYTLVGEHLQECRETPIIVDQLVLATPFGPLFDREVF